MREFNWIITNMFNFHSDRQFNYESCFKIDTTARSVTSFWVIYGCEIGSVSQSHSYSM